MNTQRREIAIIGAGISGIRSAYLLAKNSPNNIQKIVIFDKSETIGGVLKNTCINNYRLEHGAQGVLLSRSSFWNCLKDVQLENSVLLPPKKASTRYILTPNHCVAITPNIFNLRKNGLLRFRDLFRILAEIFIKKPTHSNMNDTLYTFFSRHFGKKFTDSFLVSLTFGIWGGGAKKILVRHAFPKLINLENGYGSLLKGLFYNFCRSIMTKEKKPDSHKGLGSFELGMHHLVQSIFNELVKECRHKNIEIEVKLKTNVQNITKISENIFIEFCEDKLLKKLAFHSVIYTGQPWRDQNLAFMVDNINYEELQKALEVLKTIESHSIAVVGLGTKERNQESPNGFGALAGEWSKDILGVIFVHSTYPKHAPENSCLFRVLIGGDRNIKVIEKNDSELIHIAKARLLETNIVTHQLNYDFEHVIKWENYIPLATVKQDKIMESIWKIEAIMPGLFFAGNYIKGPAISDCLEQAEVVCKNVLAYHADKKNYFET